MKKLIDPCRAAPQVYRLIPERTFGRRLAKDETLKSSEADAIGRLIRITEEAEKTFGDTDFAHKWLTYPNPALGDRIPIEMAETDAGARASKRPHAHRLWLLQPWRRHGGLLPAPFARELDDEGASLAGGRWNSRGVPMFYTSSHLSFCCP